MAQKAIGANFGNELQAAGLLGLPFSWHDDGTIEFGAAMTDAQKAAVNAVYAAHDPAKADPAAQAAALLAGGLEIASTATPAVNGTYACDDAQQDIITRVQAYITKNDAFPGGMSSLQLRTAAGGLISVPSVALFQAIGTAIADFVARVDEAELVALGGGAWVAPSNTATIA